MKVVSNSSPLVNLSRVAQLDLLQQLYGKVLIPEAVYHEVVVKGRGMPGAFAVAGAEWIVVRAVKDLYRSRILSYDLDPGEAECIALAIEEEADVLLMDERIGREKARHLGLQCVGILGLLIEAKQRGFICLVNPILENLRDMAGFRVHKQLYSTVLRMAGEDGQ